MTNNDLCKYADAIYSMLNSIENQNKNRQEQIDLIKPIINEIASESRNTGRRQAANLLKDVITTMEDK